MSIALSTDQGIVLMEALIEELRAVMSFCLLSRPWNDLAGKPIVGPNSRCSPSSPKDSPRSNESNSTRFSSYRQTLDERGFHGCANHPAKPSSFLKVIERLQYIRGFGLDPLLVRRIHANRLRRLAHEGEQYTPQFLERFEPLRRYATLVAYLLDMTATLTDWHWRCMTISWACSSSRDRKNTSPNLNNAAKPSTKRCACMLMWATR
jgi:hypothetical protein